MATLEKIRNKAGLLVIVVGLALFAFIIGDFLNSGSTFFRQSHEKVAEVNGEKIDYQQYHQRVEEMVQYYKNQANTNSVPEEMMANLRQNVFDTMVQEVILDEQLDKVGLTVGPEELFDMVQGENISPEILQMNDFRDPETGMFNKAALSDFLKTINMNPADMNGLTDAQKESIMQAKYSWLFLERNIKRSRLQQKYTTLLSKAVSYNKLDARAAYEGSAVSSDIAFAMQSYSSIADSTVTADQSAVKKLYEQRKEAYKRPESKVIEYIAVDIRPSRHDYYETSRQIESLKEEFLASDDVAGLVNDKSDKSFVNTYASINSLNPDVRSFVASAEIGEVYGPVFEDEKYNMYKLVDKTVGPDSLDLAQIILPKMNQPEFTAYVDSLVNALRKGADFAEAAAEHSIDQQAAMYGGRMGWATEADIVLTPMLGEEIKNALFAAPAVNQVVVANSTYYTHIIKILDKTPNVTKYKIADIEMAVSPSSATYGDLYNALSQFIAQNRDIEKWDEKAKDAGYQVLSATLTANDQNVGAVRGSRQVVRWAFQNGKKGKISDIIDCGDAFVVAGMKGTIKEGYRSLESVQNSLKSELVAQKKGEIISNELKSKNLSSLDAYASAMDSKVDTVRFVSFDTPRITNIGVEPKLNAAISLAPVNQVAQPVAGNNGVYVFEVFNRNEDAPEYNEAEQINTLNASNMYRFGYQTIQSLVRKADIEDNRIRFY